MPGNIHAVRLKVVRRLAFVALIPVVGCSGDDAGTSGTTILMEESDRSTFDFTPTITITDDGFVPAHAVAVFGETLTFVNETNRPQTIQFTNGSPAIGGAETIGPIPAGGSVSLDEPLETAISLVYDASDLPGETGRLQVDPGVDSL